MSSWPLQEDFKDRGPVSQVPTSWFVAVSRILNHIGGIGCKINKTANPSAENPWNIEVEEGQSAVVDNDSANIKDVGTANSSGGENTVKASKSDHVHKDKKATNPDYTGYDFQATTEGADYNNTTSWTASSGNTKGCRFTIVDRVRYSESDSTPTLKAFARNVIIDEYGRVYQIGAEFNYVIDQPVEGY